MSKLGSEITLNYYASITSIIYISIEISNRSVQHCLACTVTRGNHCKRQMSGGDLMSTNLRILFRTRYIRYPCVLWEVAVAAGCSFACDWIGIEWNNLFRHEAAVAVRVTVHFVDNAALHFSGIALVL